MSTPTAASPFHTRYRLPFIGLMAVSFIYFVLQIAKDFSRGGNPWKQGDWLINSVNVPVRRSFSGDVLIWVSDATGIGLVLLVCVAQVVLAAVVYFTVTRLALRDGSGSLMLITLSGSFFVFFWMADAQGAGRKELLAFASLGLFTLGLAERRLWMALLGAVLMPMAVASHEAMILFLPIMGIVYLVHRQKVRRRRRIFDVFAWGSAFACFAILGEALLTAEIVDHMVVCTPLLERNVPEVMCSAAIQWLEEDLAHGVGEVMAATTFMSLLQLAIGYVLALVPLVYVAQLSTGRMAMLLALLPALLFLPLYIFSLDYGRWISFHIFASFILFAATLGKGRVKLREKPSVALVPIFALLGAAIVHNHTSMIYWGGVIRRLGGDVLEFVL